MSTFPIGCTRRLKGRCHPKCSKCSCCSWLIVLSLRRQSHIAALACLRRLLSRPSLSAGATAHKKGRSEGYHLPGRVPLPPEKTKRVAL